jgi:hypothetical protein
MAFLVWIQDSSFSTWLRESDWALFALLIVHTIGMAFLTGVSMVVALRTYGVAVRLPLQQIARFTPAIRNGLIAAMVSGLFLVISYPAKALTNPLFYIKLLVIAAAVFTTRKLLARALANSDAPLPGLGKCAALLSIALWALAITAGKFLAYTNTMLLVYQ